MTEFKALRVNKNDEGVTHEIVQRSTDDLPSGDVLIRVSFSSVNYKDALSAKGLPGVTRHYPHTPGIDAAGIVVETSHEGFKEGDEVICIGFDLGMNTPGGFGEYIRVPGEWVTRLPVGLTLRESMILGTAGFTAALCLDKLERIGASPDDGPVVVTGATGGVGSVAVSLLAHAGYEVTASSGKSDRVDYLKALGATTVIDREALSSENPRPMLSTAYAHGVDTVGGTILSNVVRSLQYGGSVAICGLVASPNFEITVLPFILRGVNILGVDSVELPIVSKNLIWQRLANDWKLDSLARMTQETDLAGVSEAVDKIFRGDVTGRTLITH